MSDGVYHRSQIQAEEVSFYTSDQPMKDMTLFYHKSKQLETMEYSNSLDSTITSYARCTREIKSRIVMAKAAFNRKKNLFTSKLDLNLRKKLVKCYI